jgi:hypothetical protein
VTIDAARELPVMAATNTRTRTPRPNLCPSSRVCSRRRAPRRLVDELRSARD